MTAARTMLLMLLALTVWWLGGCAAQPERAGFAVSPGMYAQTLDAAREVLRDYRFTIDRVDAAGGVITTAPKPTSGLATPWDAEQSSVRDEFEDLLNRQQRRARVTFTPTAEPGSAEPGSAEPTPAMDASTDLRHRTGTLMMTVDVVIERVQRPDWRPVPKAVRSSSIAVDPEKARRQIAPTSAVPIRTDPELAQEIMEKIIARQNTADAARPSSDPTP